MVDDEEKGVIETEASCESTAGSSEGVRRISNTDIALCLVAVILCLFEVVCWFRIGAGKGDVAFHIIPFIMIAIGLVVLSAWVWTFVSLLRLGHSQKVYGNRWIRAGLLIIIPALAFLSMIGPDWFIISGLRYLVNQTGGTEPLQEWACGILDQPDLIVHDIDENNIWFIKEDLQTDQIRQIRLSKESVRVERKEDQRYIVIPTGGGGFLPGWGICVGRPTLHINGYKWSDGVYGWIGS
ncbi:MAG: hypothetical protein JW860_03570 [Sedimentisphaerales bacterium]|nr:hypothetical protein [Sedimentisphaerales bacterium]